jgi:signal transduction histidine kinase
VRLETMDGLARVSVHDEGIGVPPVEQPLLWERFYQAEATAWQSGSQIGLGMGLDISKTIVERHHGQVGIESSPGHGATFWFTLPLSSDERN